MKLSVDQIEHMADIIKRLGSIEQLESDIIELGRAYAILDEGYQELWDFLELEGYIISSKAKVN